MERIRGTGNPHNWLELEEQDHDADKANERKVFSGFNVDKFEEMDYDHPDYDRLAEEFNKREELMYAFEPMKYFDVIGQSPYHLEIQRVSIEDIGEGFFDSGDLKEMDIRNEGGFYVDKKKMRTALAEQIVNIPIGMKSVDIDDLQLLDIMKDEGISPADLGHEGYVRRAGKIAKKYVKPPPAPVIQTTANHEDWHCLTAAANRASGDKHCLMVDAIHDDEDWYKEDDEWKHNRLKALTAIKKLLLWKDMVEAMSDNGYEKEDVKWIKQIWSNPMEAFNKM